MNAPLTLAPRSSLGSKFLMALTGLGLTGFVIAHMIGNLQVFSGRDALNSYAAALKHLGGLLWAFRIGLLLIFVLHIIYGLRLWFANRAARPVLYHFKKYRQASLASRTMLWTGCVILAFVLFHLAHFTFLWVNPSYAELHDDQGRHDVYAMTILGFRNPMISLLYIIAIALLAIHLSHGIQSLFQSLGLSHPHWTPMIKMIGGALAVIIFVGNTSMPLAVLFRIIGTDVPS
jgi:succinate dehydrogenase / fumarate reductase cytochrome b subunit